VTHQPDLDPSTKLCVTRHGETDWNVTGILQGWIDVPLNDTGRQQSYELAEALANTGFTAVCSSPLRRSAETAEILAKAWGLPAPEFYDGLKERNFGQIQGMPKRELSVSHPGLYQEIVRRNPTCHFDDGESLDHFADRVLDALYGIAHTHGGQRVVIITHGWVMDVMTRHVRNLSRASVLDMKRKNGESLWLRVDSHSMFSECSEHWG
jgi:2,3-bisphosphoglycerate-dependent phosphoglycerate mutase